MTVRKDDPTSVTIGPIYRANMQGMRQLLQSSCNGDGDGDDDDDNNNGDDEEEGEEEDDDGVMLR